MNPYRPPEDEPENPDKYPPLTTMDNVIGYGMILLAVFILLTFALEQYPWYWYAK
jgi:hypothetical protein